MNSTVRNVCCVLLMSAAATCLAQQAADDAPAQLLNRLSGHWELKGMLGGKEATHDVDGEWVLNHEYLRLHEVSREKAPSGGPLYEAIILINWNAKAQEYLCLWLDNTSDAGLSNPMAHAKREENAISLVWVLSPTNSLHTTFTYDRGADGWHWTIDDVNGGKADRFADMRLTRRR